MIDEVAGATEVGRACPYCRFPLKEGIAVHHCHVCGALHHADCWHEGNGCAVFGCVGAGSATPSASEPTTATPPPPPPPPGRSGLYRWLPWIVVFLLVAGGVGTYLVATRQKTQVVTSTSTTVSTTSNGSTGPATGTGPVDTGPNPAQRAAQQLNAVLQFSLQGRTDVQNNDYQGAVANRQAVLQRLNSITDPNQQIAHAVDTLKQAMQASLQADQAYSSGSDPSADNAAATMYKQQFVSRWSSIASMYGLPQYAADQI